METKFQNTFIPKTALDTPGSAVRRPTNFLTFIAMILFLISLAVAGGVYFWNQYLTGQVTSLTTDLQKNKDAFEPGTIEEYARLNSRFNNAKNLLKAHVSTSAFFSLLDKDTLQTVQFSDLKYSQDNTGVITIAMSGKAKSYNSVAYQSKVFSSEPAFKNAVFSNLDLDSSGNVVFEFNAQVDPTFVTYQNNLAAYQNISNQNVQDNSASSSNTDTTGGLSFPAAATNASSTSNNSNGSQ